MRTVGIKLADGSFYPIMEEGSAQTKKLELTTANDNQTCVMVDLYRSKTCSMEDAEYIDTLKIENLNAHQNGEPSISFDVELDENGELSASIADPETGTTSNSQLTLVSRTAEERLVPDDFAVDQPVVEDAPAEEETSVDEPAVEETAEDDSDSGNGAAVAAGVVAGAGLLAAAGIMAANKNKDNDDELPSEEVSLTDDDIEDVTGEAGLDDFSFDDAPTTDTPADDTISDDAGLEAFSLDDTPSEDTIADELTADDSGLIADDSGLIADDSGITADDSGADETITDEALPDMDFDMPEESAEPVDEDATITDEGFDLPDDTTQAADDSFDIPEDTTQTEDDSFDLPDDTTIPGDETILEDETFAAPSELTENTEEDTDDFFNDPEPTPSPSEGLNFTGLYDKETEMGDSSAHEEDDIKKKTRAPVIICIVCAIICIIATLLVLLVLPGKFNLRQKHADKKAQTAVEKQAETTTTTPAPVEEKKPDPVPQAKEDEVVVIEKAEDVKPVPPPAATETKSKNVTYKIKWGDTLWDIADTYYKNPWRYKKIANYNGIKNPDHIISGTIIIIPAE